MTVISPYFHPAKLISYDKIKRTAKVGIVGLTDGVPEGITAMLAYPIGDDDLDTERELKAGADIWVFFEQGDTSMPVIAFYRRHGEGAVVDTRRIRQENIELLARAQITLSAANLIAMSAQSVTIDAQSMTINADNLSINAAINHSGDQNTSGTITASNDVNGGGISLKGHMHSGVRSGSSNSGPPH
ncbi:hypothetical protein [Psychrobacter sp.]|uniref:hypothetical protein n=1 Tax=Psychrobacter sp. TaxID=56811 RepID=UPI0025E4A17C|nr:hypothetical protein [Psychrobacter sp.]